MDVSEIISQMKPADYITLGIGISTIFSTFCGVWLGAYLSGRYAAKQGHKVNHLSTNIWNVRTSAQPLARKMEESRNLFSAVNEALQLFKDKSEEEIEKIDEQILKELERRIEYCTELVCNFYENGLSTQAQRLLVKLQVEAKDIPYLYSLIAINRGDITLTGYAWAALNQRIQNIVDILKKMDSELEKIDIMLNEREKELRKIL